MKLKLLISISKEASKEEVFLRLLSAIAESEFTLKRLDYDFEFTISEEEEKK